MVFSVRFFKRMILVALALMIIIPVCTSVGLGISADRERKAGQELAIQLEKTQQQLAALLEAESIGGVYLPPKEGENGEAVPPVGQVGGLNSAEGMDYQKLFPDLYNNSQTPSQRVRAANTVYLTFDDGPSARTAEILEILDRYSVKATFFAVGREDPQSRQQLQSLFDGGHALGVHTYSHDYKKVYASVEAYLDDFHQMYRLLFDATGSYPQIFRFPGGSVNGYNAGIYRDIIAEMERRGFVYFDWNADAADTAANAQPENVAKRALSGVSERRAVVLLHDSGSNSVILKALPAIIEGYQAAGFTFEVLTPQVRQVTLS